MLKIPDTNRFGLRRFSTRLRTWASRNIFAKTGFEPEGTNPSNSLTRLVEKYLYSNHAPKTKLPHELLTEVRLKTLAGIHSEFNVQPPDLLVFTPGRSRLWPGSLQR
jgi:hypothetical protein